MSVVEFADPSDELGIAPVAPVADVVDEAADVVAAEAGDVIKTPVVDDEDTGDEWADVEPEDAPAGKVEAKEDAPAEAAAEPEFSADLLKTAGLTIEDARKHFGTQDALEKAIAWQDAQMLAYGRQLAQGQAPQTPAPVPATRPVQQQAPPQAPPPKVEAPAPAQDLEKYRLKLDPKDWDEQTMALVNNITDHFGRQLDEMASKYQAVEGGLTGLLEQQRRQIETSYYDQFDQSVNALDESYQETFGKGDRFNLDHNSEAFRNRVRLDEAMAAIARGRQAAGHAPLASQQLFDRALRSEFGQVRDAALKKEVAVKVSRRQSTMVARPTNKRSKGQTGEERAVDFVKDFFKGKGISEDEDDTEFADGI